MAYTPREAAAAPSPATSCAPASPAGASTSTRRTGPSVPKEQFDPDRTGAHWDFPERQPEKWPRERSIEHAFLTPVFGTVAARRRGCPGAIRRLRLRAVQRGARRALAAADRRRPGRRRREPRRVAADAAARTTRSPRPASRPSSPTTASRRAPAPAGRPQPRVDGSVARRRTVGDHRGPRHPRDQPGGAAGQAVAPNRSHIRWVCAPTSVSLVRWKFRPPRPNVARTAGGAVDSVTGVSSHEQARTCTRSTAAASASLS